MADEDDPVTRGPKGGRKHTPGRDHDRKSKDRKRARRERKAATAREARRLELLVEWAALSPELRRLLGKSEPKKPRPNDGSRS